VLVPIFTFVLQTSKTHNLLIFNYYKVGDTNFFFPRTLEKNYVALSAFLLVVQAPTSIPKNLPIFLTFFLCSYRLNPYLHEKLLFI
jgi:hypothetical protein